MSWLTFFYGRVTPHNFTYGSVKGKAVVDYVIVPLQTMKYCDYFRVHTATEIVSKLCAENDKIPVYSPLEFKFHRNEYLFSKRECLSIRIVSYGKLNAYLS